MTVQWGDTGRTAIGTLKTLNITPYVSEQNVTSTALPVGANASSVPASPVFSFTVNSTTMAPTFSGVKVLNYVGAYGFCVSGQNTSGAAQTVYFQINKNGSSYKTGSLSITNNNYWTVTLCDATIVNGNVIDVYIWTPAASGVNYFYQCTYCQPSQVDTGAKNICQVTYTCTSFQSSTYFPLTGKVGSKGVGQNYVFTNTTNFNSQQLNYTAQNSGQTTLNLLSVNNTYKLFRVGAGDQSGVYSDIGQSSTQYPLVDGSYQITSISYRDLFY